MIKQVKNVDPWTYVIEDFIREKSSEHFIKKITKKLKSSRVLSSKSNQERR